MRYLRHDVVACCFLVFLLFLGNAKADWKDLLLQDRAVQLPQKELDYGEYTDNEETDRPAPFPEWNQVPAIEVRPPTPRIANDQPYTLDNLDKNITWDSNWVPNVKLGQISAVSIDPYGRIAIFHRGSRIWGSETFDNENRFNPEEGPVRENTVVLLDKSGKRIIEWGRNTFYLPHGLTVDSLGNYWVTDVAMHQVFKFDAKDIENHVEDLKKEQLYPKRTSIGRHNINELFQTNILKPSLTLGQAFEPGNDDKRFCKPTAVAVHPNGDFFVSDGYCNSRVIKYNAKGEKILQWGRHWGLESMYSKPPPNAFFIPHALALADELDYLFVADRENGRVLSFFARNGTFHRQYQHPSIGTKIYSVAYADKKIYLINGPDLSNNFVHVRGFVLDVSTGNLLSQFGPRNDMDRPHDLAVTQTGSEIYVVELNVHKVYRFLQDVNASAEAGAAKPQSVQRHDSILSVDKSTSEPTTGGCLLAVRNKMRWDNDKRENFKLSSLLEAKRCKRFKLLEKSRPNSKDFSKLNTEPETSDDERSENNLTKII